MQLHELKLKNKNRKPKRIGRGGKRGSYSGRGSKGQLARGARLGADFRGGNAPIWKVFPKKRGSSKKTVIKHRAFRLRQTKPVVVNLKAVNGHFSAGELVDPKSLYEKGIVKSADQKIKILGDGVLDKKLVFSGLVFSKPALEKISKSGAEIK